MNPCLTPSGAGGGTGTAHGGTVSVLPAGGKSGKAVKGVPGTALDSSEFTYLYLNLSINRYK